MHALAEKLSAAHTLARGHRTLDVLHVAAAVHLRADLFCTVDRLQAELARAAGLKVRPPASALDRPRPGESALFPAKIRLCKPGRRVLLVRRFYAENPHYL